MCYNYFRRIEVMDTSVIIIVIVVGINVALKSVSINILVFLISFLESGISDNSSTIASSTSYFPPVFCKICLQSVNRLTRYFFSHNSVRIPCVDFG